MSDSEMSRPTDREEPHATSDEQKGVDDKLWFPGVLEKELEILVKRRKAAGLSVSPADGETQGSADPETTSALRKELVGLALSGGGLRAATFSLGVMRSVSDGGFVDFLGVDELQRRRCRIIINSENLELSVLGEAVRKARLDHGCEILDIDDDKPLDVRRLKRDEGGLTAQHMILGRILYPRVEDRVQLRVKMHTKDF